MRKNVIGIPVEGSSGQYPSGPVAFLNDWPGLWLRGDDSIMLYIHLRSLKKQCKERGIPFDTMLDEIMDCIENGVRVKKSADS